MKRTKWLWLFLAALAVRSFVPAGAIESGYGYALFPTIRVVQGFISDLSPVPLVWLLLPGLAAALVWTFWRKGKGSGLWFLFSTVFCLAFTFILLWGLHYQRVPFEHKVGLEVRPLDEDAVEREYEIATAQVLETRAALGQSMDQVVSGFPAFEELGKALLPGVRSVVESWGYPAQGKVRIRLLYPKGVLLRFSASGVYLPWTGEGHIDAGLYPLNWPFVIAHEMTHGYGLANEGVCNFIAYQVCLSDQDPFVRYAGALYYWRYAAFEMQRFCPAEVEGMVASFPNGIQQDLEAIRENYDRYPDLIPQWKNLVYDSFLKSQGLKEGIMSYETVLVLTNAWRYRESQLVN